MESQYKDNSNGNTDVNGGEEEYVAVGKMRKMVGWGLFLRVAAVVLSLAAAVVMGLDKQTKTVAMPLVPTLPPVDVRVTAEWHYMSAFVYFVVANGIASAYGAISLVMLILGNKRKSVMMIVIVDLVMAALLCTSFGAAAAVGLIGFQGNSHLQWRKVCNVFQRFCVQGAVAMLLSGGASFIFLFLVCVPFFSLRNIN